MTVVLAGPRSIDGVKGNAVLDECSSRRRAVDPDLGNLTRQELAEAIAESEVGLIPYVENAYTAGVFPMKVYEYLAGGLSVVATRLPSLLGRTARPGLFLEQRETFTAAVIRELLDRFDEGEASARASAAAGKSWTDRARQAEALLAGLRSGAGARAGLDHEPHS